jgi:hypothetical protein
VEWCVVSYGMARQEICGLEGRVRYGAHGMRQVGGWLWWWWEEEEEAGSCFAGLDLLVGVLLVEQLGSVCVFGLGFTEEEVVRWFFGTDMISGMCIMNDSRK